MKCFVVLCEFGSRIWHTLLFNKIIKSEKRQQAEQYEEAEHQEYINILKDFTMFGETAQCLWRSNFRAFKKVEDQVQKGNNEGNTQWKQIQVLCDGADHPQLHFNEEYWWKMEVIWHVTVLMCCYCHSNSNSNKEAEEAKEAIGNALKYGSSELWGILTLMEQNELQNLIADNEFSRLERLWEKCLARRDKANKYLEDELKHPLDEAFKKLQSGDVDRDDWMRQEIARYFDTRCKLSVSSSDTMEKVLADTMEKGTKWILASLYHTLRHCICEYMQKGVLEKCYKWASELDEDNLCRAAFEIGKAQGLIEAHEAEGLMEPANVV